MNRADKRIDQAAVAALVILAAALVCVITTLPAMPVDETRYLTVAWEMRSTGSWSLPTLNFEPYSHKPPLLFWLINAAWSVFGVAVWPARLVGALATAAVLVLTHVLDRRLAPTAERKTASSVLMLLTMPLFVTLGFSIMFDMLLTATVSAAMLALWIAGRTGDRKAFVGYGIGVGLGLLAKGPIVLLFALPTALLAPYWIDPEQRRGWPLRIGLSLALGIGMALAWALRAAYLGGPDYAEMLFWKQSAGRITSSFAHARPFWFYIPILMLFLTPLLLWRPARTGFRTTLANHGPARNFLLSWILPALAGLTLISGKQIHYLLPLLPALALLASLGLKDAEPRPADRRPLLIFAGVIFAVLMALTWAAPYWLPEGGLETVVSKLSLPLVALTGAVAIAAIAVMSSSTRRTLMGLAIANLVVLTSLAAQSRTAIGDLFDLQPAADTIAAFQGKPIAVAQETRGEFGFLARLRRPVVFVPSEELPCWLSRNPDGIAIVRERQGDERASFDRQQVKVLYEERYRLQETITVLTAMPGEHAASACGGTGPG